MIYSDQIRASTPPGSASPAARRSGFAERIRKDLVRWNKVVAEAGVKPE